MEAPPPLNTTLTPRFDYDKNDVVTLYQLMVRVEVKDDTFTIKYAHTPPPPLPPPPPPHTHLPLDANTMGLIRSIYLSHTARLLNRVMG